MNEHSLKTPATSEENPIDVHENIKQDIIKGRWKPGEKLSIANMRDDYEVSLSPLREALARLAATGFISAEKQRGFRVAAVSKSDLADLNDVRIKLERWALRDAITNGDKDWEGEVVAAYHRLDRTPYISDDDQDQVSDEWARRHKDFHYALVSACQSNWIMRFRDILFDEMERYRNLSIEYTRERIKVGGKKGRRDTESFEDQHKMLVDAALASDADKACDLIEAHFNKTFNIVNGILEND